MSAIKLKNKIYIVLIAIVLIVIAIVAILLINNSTNRVVITNDKEEKVMNTNALTMMYETEAGSGEYQVTSDTTWPQDGYIFNERLSGCENGSTLTWDDERKAVILSTNVSDKCYVYFDKEPEIVYFADYIIDNVYVEDGVNGLYYHDGVGIYTNANQEAGDNSYRYAGANLNNYVCFGSNEETCLDDNLYRIIGIFNNQIKLIKLISYNEIAWDDGNKTINNILPIVETTCNGSNIWNESTKPDIYTTLNETYYNSLESEWQKLISETTWQVGGMAWSTTNTVKQYYDVEVGTAQNGYEETMKIGLIYVSDYGYATSPENWTTALTDYNNAINPSNNWLYLDANEWTISSSPMYTGDNCNVFYINNLANIWHNYPEATNAVRPVFYLNSDVTYISGSGTQSDPFRIA